MTFSPTLNEQETMHCEEEHKVEPTLPGEEKKQKTPIDAFVVNMHFVLQHVFKGLLCWSFYVILHLAPPLGSLMGRETAEHGSRLMVLIVSL